MTKRNGLIVIIIIGLLVGFTTAAFDIDGFIRLGNAQKVNNKLAHQALTQNQEIQRQRYDITLANCIDQNTRHDKTLAEFKKDTAIPLSQRSSSGGTALLLNAAIPHRNCTAVAAASIKAPGPPIPKSLSPTPTPEKK